MIAFEAAVWVEGLVKERLGDKYFWKFFSKGDRISGSLAFSVVSKVSAKTTRSISTLEGKLVSLRGIMHNGELFATHVALADGRLPHVSLKGEGKVERVQPFYGAQKLVVRLEDDTHVAVVHNDNPLRSGSEIKFSGFIRNGNIVASELSVTSYPPTHLHFGATNPAIDAIIQEIRSM